MVKMSGDPKLEEAISQWLEWDKNEKTRNEIIQLQKENEYDNLKKYLLKRMEFGTAGLRAEMGAGNSRMNDLTVIQTTQGFCKYLLQQFGDGLKSKGVIIGYDSRHNSSRFARLAANVFGLQGVKVYLYSKIVPTPFVPYGVLRYKTCAGIMVTASHNPKQDNGYKVYWENGSQIIPPHDSGIAECISASLAPTCADVWNEDLLQGKPGLVDPYDEVMLNYFKDLKSYCKNRSINSSTSLRFTYTPVHGVGLAFARKSFETFSLPTFENVPEQMNPDPEFSTVKYPNPEEGKGVLLLAMRTADETGCKVILANDPDADRLAIAEKQDDGSWKVFSGNELGSLIGWWVWYSYITNNPDTVDRSNIYMLSSTVSSMILQAIAEKEGFKFEDTLTGFKWMGNRTDQLLKEGKTVLFAFEEAIGYMIGTNVLDKDGISAMSVVAECACFLETKGTTLTQQLQNIYNTYGDHVSSNSYYICHDPSKIEAMFQRLRNYDDNDVITDPVAGSKYPSKVGKFQITGIRDLTTGFDSRQNNNKATLPTTPSSHMITFYFANGVVLTIRTSGTEPKIKYYSEICGSIGRQREELVQELNELVELMCQEFYQPDKNGFLARTS
uniref:Phosphoglucomutase-2 n=1 Tax=Ciona intestinalis TaxID=7719 RepID=F6ZWW6_CIOIN|nr:phosphoglucomutase-2 [Ciona intestinalis]|eukprot:XP_002127972.1 phosphoglucomutase-2 [Ciona intestinalis]